MGQPQHGLRSPPGAGERGAGPGERPGTGAEVAPGGEGGSLALVPPLCELGMWGPCQVVCPGSAAMCGTGRRPGLSPYRGQWPQGRCCPPVQLLAVHPPGLPARRGFPGPGPSGPQPHPPSNPCVGRFMKPAGQKLPLCEGAGSAPTCQGLEWGAAPQPQPLLALPGSPLPRCPWGTPGGKWHRGRQPGSLVALALG